MKKVILLMFVPFFGFTQIDFFIDIRNDEGDIMWENITTSELSMDFHFTLGTSEQYANHQQKIRDRVTTFGVNGLEALANLSSVYDCEKEWAELVNRSDHIKHPIIITDTIAFTKNHKIVCIQRFRIFSLRLI